MDKLSPVWRRIQPGFQFFLKVRMPGLDLKPAAGAEMMDALLVSEPALSLEDIRRPIEAELEAFRRYYREAMRSPVALLDKVVQYMLRRKGKRIRPLLVLLSAKLCGGITETSYRGAALVELLHTATLVHDDVVDDAHGHPRHGARWRYLMQVRPIITLPLEHAPRLVDVSVDPLRLRRQSHIVLTEGEFDEIGGLIREATARSVSDPHP